MSFLQIQDTSTSNGLMLRNSFFAFLLVGTKLFSASVTLVNDSAFKLTGEIFNAMGIKVASVRLSPGQIYMWNDNQSPFIKQNDSTSTPFTISFVCADARPYDYAPPPKKGSKDKKPAYQSEFGSWVGVPTGSTVNALGVNGGTKTCVIKKSVQKGTTERKKSHPKNIKSDGFNNWSNDGGSTWTNDGGFGDDDSDFSENLK
jgi:hypothetical protein